MPIINERIPKFFAEDMMKRFPLGYWREVANYIPLNLVENKIETINKNEHVYKLEIDGRSCIIYSTQSLSGDYVHECLINPDKLEGIIPKNFEPWKTVYTKY